MDVGTLGKKKEVPLSKGESVAIGFSILLLLSLFAYAFYASIIITSRTETWTVRIFEAKIIVSKKQDLTITAIYPYRNEIQCFYGAHNFTDGKTYTITYQKQLNSRYLKLLDYWEVS